jgi:hypothetical protein
MDIKPIQQATRQAALIFAEHAIRQMARRSISVEEVTEAILNGEIIEDYPDDKYSPSCLILGSTRRGRALHVQCSAPPRVRVVTVYRPDAGEWIEDRIRRRS